VGSGHSERTMLDLKDLKSVKGPRVEEILYSNITLDGADL
jgi:hypothetical protein